LANFKHLKRIDARYFIKTLKTSRASILQGVKWNSISQILSSLLQLLQVVWLARILPPSEWGLMAMTWVVVRLASPLFLGGIGQAIIQQKDLSREQFSSIFWVQGVLGLFAFAAVNASSPLWVLFFDEPGLSGLLLLASLAFLIMPAGNAFQALLTRRLDFGNLSVIQLVSLAADLAVSLFMAYRGWGAFSMAWGFLVRSAVATLLATWFSRNELPALNFHFASIRLMLRFALFETGNNLVYALSSVIDKALIGRFLSPHELGLYSIAWELAMIPVSRINPLLTRVFFPVFAGAQDQPDKINSWFQKMTQALLLLNFPILTALALYSGPILRVFLGPEWEGAALCLSLLSLLGLGKMLANLGAGALLARGRSDVTMAWNILATAGAAISLLLFARSLESAALAQGIAFWALIGVWLYWLEAKGGIRLRPFFEIVLKRAALCLPPGVAFWISGHFFDPGIWALVATFLFVLIIYLLTLVVFDRRLLNNILP
jgi:O-antigen/teichoic acid export membrane protein